MIQIPQEQLLERGKYKIELHVVGDGRIFLNYWDWAHGRDVVAELINGKLFEDDKPIEIDEFIAKVLDSVSKIDPKLKS